MKKTLLALTILAAFVLTGCGSESKTVNESKTPEAKPAIKVEEQQKDNKQQSQSTTGKKVYKMGNKPTFEDFMGKKTTEQSVHQFKTNNN